MLNVTNFEHTKQRCKAVLLLMRRVYLIQNQHAKHTQNTPEIAISVVLRRAFTTDLPWIWSRLNSIWKGQALQSGKWWNSKERKQKDKKKLQPRLRWQAGIKQMIVEIQRLSWARAESVHNKKILEDGTTQTEDSPQIWSSVKSDCSERNWR